VCDKSRKFSYLGDEVTTADVNLLKEFKVGSAIIARPIHVGDTSLLIDITLSISDEVKDLIVNDINKLHNQYESVYNRFYKVS